MNGLQKSNKKFKLEKVLKDDSLNYVLIGIKVRKPPLIQFANTTCKNMELDNLKRNRFAGEEELEEFMLPVLLKYESLCNQIPFKYVCVCGQAGLQYNYIIVHKDKIASTNALSVSDLLVVGSSCFKSVSIMVPEQGDTCFKKCAGHTHGFNSSCKFKINPNINSIQSFMQNALMRGDKIRHYYNSNLWKFSGLCYDCKNIYVGELMRPLCIGDTELSINAYIMFQTEKNKNNLFEHYNYMKEKQLHNKKEYRIKCLMICFTKKLLASYAELAMSDNLFANS